MRPIRVDHNRLLVLLRDKKIMTVDALAGGLNCSRNTVFLKLAGIGCITSYSHNRRYVALLEHAQFSQFGLWEYDSKWFSRWDGVRPTIKHLVDGSPQGLTAGEINDMLHVRANTQLGILVKGGEIVRVKEGRNQVYFSANESVRMNQMQNRKIHLEGKISIGKTLPQYISKTDLLKILCVIVKYHATKKEDMEQLLREEGTVVKKRTVDWVFKRFDIEKKGSPFPSSKL